MTGIDPRRPAAQGPGRRPGHHRPAATAHLRVRRPGALQGHPGPGRLPAHRGRVRRPSGPAPRRACRSWPAARAPACPAAPCRTPTASSSSPPRCGASSAVAPPDERAVVEPGVINLQVTTAASPHGYYYAPDPSSQQICSIGGNVAENSGGAHCLKYGFTTNHVTGAQIVTPDGDLVRLGGRGAGRPGLRPARRVRRLGGHAGHRDRGDRAPDPAARDGADPARRLRRTDRAGAATSAIIARRGGAGRRRDDGRASPSRPPRRRALRVPGRRGRGADRRAGRARRRGRGPVRRGRALLRRQRRVRDPRRGRRRRAGAVLEGPQVGVRRGRPDQPRLHRPGRRHPADGAARGAAPHRRGRRDARRAGGQRLSRRRRQPAPAGALRRRRRRRGRTGRERSPARSSTCASSTAARSPASTASASTRRGTCRGCSPTTTSTRCSWCGAPSTRHGLANPGQDLPDAAAVRRGARTPQRLTPGPGGRTSRRCSDWRSPLDALGDLARPAGDDDAVGGRTRAVRRRAGLDRSRPPPSCGPRRPRASPWWCAAAAPSWTGRRRPGGSTWSSTPAGCPACVEHAAGDLIAVVRAGTAMDELQENLAPAGQQLALDTPLPGATVGGTVAVSTSGPRRAALRHRPRPGHRHHRRAARRGGRPRGRQGRQERRRVRPGQAAHRLLRHPRA